MTFDPDQQKIDDRRGLSFANNTVFGQISVKFAIQRKVVIDFE